MKRRSHMRNEKGDLKDHFTIKEVALTLGVSDQTIEHGLRLGWVPKPVARTPHGWRLWSKEQVSAMIRARTRA